MKSKYVAKTRSESRAYIELLFIGKANSFNSVELEYRRHSRLTKVNGVLIQKVLTQVVESCDATTLIM